MRLTIIALSVLLSGCTTVPVIPQFPDAPEYLLESCPELQPAPKQATLSVLLSTVSANYSTAHECRVKVDQWQQWYKAQKKIFSSK